MANLHPLYVMIKPPVELADAIGALPQTDANRPSDLLHVTVLPLGDLADIDTSILALIKALLESMALSPFRLVFDRIHDSGRTIALRPSEPLNGAVLFQRALAATFDRRGPRITPRYVFRPHITLAYRGGTPGDTAIDPISWLVQEICLIESVVGERRHVEHGRWTLGGMASAA